MKLIDILEAISTANIAATALRRQLAKGTVMIWDQIIEPEPMQLRSVETIGEWLHLEVKTAEREIRNINIHSDDFADAVYNRTDNGMVITIGPSKRD